MSTAPSPSAPPGSLDSRAARLLLVAFPLSLAVYILTLAPTVSGEDSGELIAAAHTLGIAHPPGYPLWCLLAKGFSVIVPVGNVAYRVNLFSAVLSAAAATALALLFARFAALSGRPAPGVALASALLFAFSRDFWAQSVIAEVYGLNILFFALALLLAFRWDDTRWPGWLYLFSFAWGLSLTNHSTMGPLGLLIALYVLVRTPGILGKPMLLVNLLGAFLLGLSVVLYMPLRSLADPAMDWGNPETLGAMLDHLLRRQYAPTEGIRPRLAGEQLQLVGHYLSDLAMQFTPVLVALVPIGAWRHFRLERRSFALLLALFAAGSYGIIWLFNYPAARQDLVIRRTFFLPSYAVTAVWLCLGLQAAGGWIAGRLPTPTLPGVPGLAVRWAPLALAALPLAWFWRENDKSDYRYAEDFGRNLLATLEHGAIIVPTSDHTTFPLIYLTAVEGLRPDVLIADKYGGIADETLEEVFERNPEARVPPPRGASRPEKLAYLIEHSGRPVYSTLKEVVATERFELATCGLAFKALPAGTRPTEAELDAVWARTSWSPGTFTKGHRDYTADMILSDVAFARARHCLLFGRKDEALEEARRSAAHAWGIKEVLNNLGGLLAENGHAREAIPFLLEAWEVEPGYVPARRNLALAHSRAALWGAGFPWFERQLEETPLDPGMLRAATRGAVSLGKRYDALKYWFQLAALDLEDPEVYREIAAYLRTQGPEDEFIRKCEARAKEAEEARRKTREALIRDLEDEAGVPRPGGAAEAPAPFPGDRPGGGTGVAR